MGKKKMNSSSEIDGPESALDSISPSGGNTTKQNLPPGWTRTTVTIKEEHLQKLKALAWWERSLQRDVLEQILEEFFAKTDVPEPKKRPPFNYTKKQ